MAEAAHRLAPGAAGLAAVRAIPGGALGRPRGLPPPTWTDAVIGHRPGPAARTADTGRAGGHPVPMPHVLAPAAAAPPPRMRLRGGTGGRGAVVPRGPSGDPAGHGSDPHATCAFAA